MKKHKKLIAMITIFFVSVTMFSVCPTSIATTITENTDKAEDVTSVSGDDAVTAATAYSETFTYATINVSSASVLAAPVWTSDVIDTLSNGYGFNIIYREYDYYYIQYAASNGVIKRGYISRSHTATTVSRWCQYDIYRAAFNNKTTAQSVYHTYYSDAAPSGSITATEGETTNSTVIVLCGYNNKYLIQYITNTSTAGSEHIKWKRGWVDSDIITLKTVSSVSNINGKTKFYLQNAATGRYLDVPSYNATDGANMHIWDFHGGYNQEWELTPRNDNGATYVTISTCQSTGFVLAVKDALAVKNTRLDLAIKGNPPSKDQEFNIVEAPGHPGEYIIYSRLTGEFLQMGVFQDDTGNGGVVAARYPYVTNYNRWKLIPVYEEGIDYNYWYDHDSPISPSPLMKLPSSISNGISATFNLDSIASMNNHNQYAQYNFIQHTINALNVWSTGNRLFTLSSGQSETNTTSYCIGDETYFGLTEVEYCDDPTCDDYLEVYDCHITMNFTSIKNHSDENNYNITNVWQSVFAHELGHALGLDDIKDKNHPRANTSIMSSNRNRNLVTGPSNSDIAAVKKLYMNGGN